MVAVPHAVLRWEKMMDVNFLTFSPIENRKGAVAVRRLRSVGEETIQCIALLGDVKWRAVLPDKEAGRGLLFTAWVQSTGKYATFP